jgi:hypothetical protein
MSVTSVSDSLLWRFLNETIVHRASLLSCLRRPAASQNSAAKLEGQVVCCAECWAEADRTKVEYGTAENLLKARGCVERDPTLLAVRDGDKFKLYQLALGKFRLPGKNWLDYVGKRVEVTGRNPNQERTPASFELIL